MDYKKKGKLIVIEGCDAVGKTTRVKNITKYLEDNNIPVHIMHFPNTNSSLGMMIYDVLYGIVKMPSILDFQKLYLLDMYLSSKTINLYLEEGYYVILDRYYYSTLIYTLASDCKRDDYIEALNYKNALNIKAPDLVLSLYDSKFSTIKKNLDGIKNKDSHESFLELQKRLNNLYSDGTIINDCENIIFLDIDKGYDVVDNSVKNAIIEFIRRG